MKRIVMVAEVAEDIFEEINEDLSLELEVPSDEDCKLVFYKVYSEDEELPYINNKEAEI